jgi:hypothetical protein
MPLLRELSFKADHILEVLLKYPSEEEYIILVEGDAHIFDFEVHQTLEFHQFQVFNHYHVVFVDLLDGFCDEDLKDIEVSLELRGLVPVELQILKPQEE